jgi:exonuclease VII large subunit
MDTPQLRFNLQPERKIFSVSELTARIRDLLAKNFTDPTVQGEISNCRPAASGHIYFTLKDEKAQIRCVFFKNQQRGMKFRPEDGLKVTVRGAISPWSHSDAARYNWPLSSSRIACRKKDCFLLHVRNRYRCCRAALG